jgi:neutral ceramidase
MTKPIVNHFSPNASPPPLPNQLKQPSLKAMGHEHPIPRPFSSPSRRRSILTLLSITTLFVLLTLAIRGDTTTNASPRDTRDGGAFNFAHAKPQYTHNEDNEQQQQQNFDSRDSPAGDKYLIGVGKADITGPVVEINFAGYANSDQKGTGLRQRLYSRAFVVADRENPNDRFVYLVLDTQSGDTAVRNGVLDGVANLGDEFNVYGQQNIALTGTHSHAGPGAWFNYLLPQFTSLGFDKQSYQALVDGAVLSIKRAHENLQEVGHV